MPAGKGARGKAAGLAPPQHTGTRSADSAPNQIGDYLSGHQDPQEVRRLITSDGRYLRNRMNHQTGCKCAKMPESAITRTLVEAVGACGCRNRVESS